MCIGLTAALALIAAIAVRSAEPALAVTGPTEMFGAVTVLYDYPEIYSGGDPLLYASPGDATIDASLARSYVYISASDASLTTTLSFSVPRGDAFGLGLHSTNAPDPASLGVTVGSSSCTGTGSFDVLRFRTAADGSLRSLRLTYEFRCVGHSEYGEVNLKHVQSGDALLAPSKLRLPDRLFGASIKPVPVAFVDTGDHDLTVSAVELSGSDPEDFSIISDGCSAQTIAPKGSCLVWVRFDPSGRGPRFADLVFDAGPTVRTAQLSANAPAGTTRLHVWGDPGDWLTSGVSYDYQPSDTQDLYVGGDTGRIQFDLYGDDGHAWSLLLDSPSRHPWATGTYQSGDGSDLAGMWITLDGHGCGDSTGSITVNSVKLERWTGVVRSVSLSFSEDCPGPGTGAGHHQGTFDYLAPLSDPKPGQVTGIYVDRTGSVTSLSWTNPADADLASIVVAWRRGERPVGSPNAGHFATSTAGTSATITGLPKGQPVTIELWAVDPLGQVGHGTVLTLFR